MTAIDFAALDLAAALDFAILVEEDAQLRYERLARLFVDDPGGAGAVFRSMVATEGEHRARLVRRRSALLGDGARIDVSALDVSLEGVDVDDDVPSTAHAALRLAIAGEQRAHDFFAGAIASMKDPAARDFFGELQREEVEHRDLLVAQLAALGPEPDCAPPPSRPPLAPEALPSDAAELRALLPRVDAATRAIATGVLVERLAPRQVADALGISPSTVARKWRGFLHAARQHLALGLAAATLGGCVGPLHQPLATQVAPAGTEAPAPAPLASAHGVALPAAPAERSSPPETLQRADEPVSAARVHAHVASRMPRIAPAMRRRIAQAVLAEARRAALDPLLILAIIHVESSFDPEATSHAGAVGLMQLLEPTFRRECERSGLAAEPDPTDPVTNVRAGVRYLRRLVDAFGGDVNLALMAYNAGPNRIGGHLRRGGVPERYFGYARKVTRELERLRALENEGAAKAFAGGPVVLPRAS